jgi:hypothetical protein
VLSGTGFYNSHFDIDFVVRSVLEKASAQLRRQLKEILFGKLNSRCIIFYNENDKHTFRARRVSVNESVIRYQNRLFEIAVDYLDGLFTSSGSVTVVLADDFNDPLGPLCRPPSQGPLSAVKSLTVTNFISSMGAAEGMSFSKQQELLAIVSNAMGPHLHDPSQGISHILVHIHVIF